MTSGEIIEASTTRFIAQCPQQHLHQPPAFGAFVRILPSGTPATAMTEQSVSASSPAPFEDPFADPPSIVAGSLLASCVPSDFPEGTLYALVYAAATGSAEPGRRPAAYGLTEAELRAEQPQIFDLLSTHFEALLIGHVQDGCLRVGLPPRPPHLHAFVHECAPAEVCALTDAPDFARRLLAASGVPHVDELLAACLRDAYRCRNNDFAFLVRIGKQIANLLREDPQRLTALLRNLEP